ncbi:hypothetical protein FRC03_007342 [Tulasnella sp. 419]|nr:hypothetical protein FRC03_007342 [Tulasnella sp. 419]
MMDIGAASSRIPGLATSPSLQAMPTTRLPQVSGSVTTPYECHAEYYDTNHHLILLVETKLFRILVSLLGLVSLVMQDMVQLKFRSESNTQGMDSDADEGILDSNPVSLSSFTANEFAAFCKWMYLSYSG